MSARPWRRWRRIAKFEVEGLFDFNDLINAEGIPNDVMNKMLHAAADVAVEAQKRTAGSMLNKGYSTGELARSIGKGRIKRTRDGKSISIIFKGSRVRGKRKIHTTSNAEIAFLNEFGNRGQPGRPFIQTANEQCADAAVEAAAKIYDKWLDSMGF